MNSDTPKPSAADAYETMEALICEMQGLRNELEEAKRQRDDARKECLEQATLLAKGSEREASLQAEVAKLNTTFEAYVAAAEAAYLDAQAKLASNPK